ncbi:MAG TPA: hypothetical protein VHC97_13010 [Thermoanaerobaculia bacterium]|jgi:hypothetical protein|nr:hypothetical protein [Thermoanaerobaculia bacterium]
MKSLGVASIGMLFLLGMGPMAMAQTPGSSARGTYRFVLEDGVVKSLDFIASTDDRGVTTGEMAFYDPSRIPDSDDPEDPRAPDAPPEFSMKASFDSLTVEKDRAIMNGTVVDSTHRSYIGKFVQLVVEDSGPDSRIPDQLTWSFCKPQPGGWVPSDAERRSDDGAYLRWWATDAERKDDVGIPSQDLLAREKSCPVYPLRQYSFAEILKWDGDIVVVQP